MSDDEKTLAFDPFQGDFGDQGDKVLKDKIGIARKAGDCNDCAQPIHPGDRVRLMTARFDGQLMNYRWCSLCCDAMAKYDDDGGDAYETRCALRNAGSAAKGPST